ncbi:hypothetical protein GCE9029_01159 [Grimontia celer]|uniref:Uncharacterized protein n=1 Tax=Grimontia celer TaxID=1796497 RepID=A0A128EWJ3_9GAMM|nr:hypothetical protein GCE9029_01159 [Grimontia celer]
MAAFFMSKSSNTYRFDKSMFYQNLNKLHQAND